MKWIKCSEQMPQDETDIVIINVYFERIAGFVNGDYLDTHDGTCVDLGDAEYWMPLPPHPAE